MYNIKSRPKIIMHCCLIFVYLKLLFIPSKNSGQSLLRYAGGWAFIFLVLLLEKCKF